MLCRACGRLGGRPLEPDSARRVRAASSAASSNGVLAEPPEPRPRRGRAARRSRPSSTTRAPPAQRRAALTEPRDGPTRVAPRGRDRPRLAIARPRYGQARLDGPRRQPGEAARPRLPVERDLRRLPLHLGLRAARRAAQAQREGRLVALDGAAPRRRRRPRRRHPHGAEGLGGERPRRHVHRPARRLPQLQGAVPRRPAARVGRVPELRREGHLHRGRASST